jgi:acyl-CoA synthetase (NDP forming)
LNPSTAAASAGSLDLARLLKPRSVAIVGASDNKASIGGQPVSFLTEFGYTGKVYPVNPRLKDIRGVTCYPSILDIPEVCDVAIVAVNAKLVAGVIEQCGQKGIPFAIILSSGFKEIGAEGLQLEMELKEVIRKSGVRVVGPNCLGLINLPDRIHAGFGSGFQYNDITRGPVAMITQSGGFGLTMVTAIERAGMGFNYIVSIGNSIDLTTLDFLEYYLERPEIKVITTFIEGIADGERLTRIGKRALEVGKPILVWKVGNTSSGLKAAASHTASLAASYDLYRTAFRAGGFIEVADANDVVDIARVFRMGKLPAGNRLAMVTGSGGAGVLVADRADQTDITLPDLLPDTLTKLKAILPGFASAANPVDISGQTSKDGTSVSNNALRLVLADPNIDMVIIRSKQSTNTQAQMDEYMSIVRETPKPVMIAFGPDRDDESKAVFDKNEIPWHVTPPRAARAAAALHEFAKKRRAYLAANKSEPRPVAKQDLKWPAGEATLSEHAAKAVLKAYGIPVVGEALMSLEEVRALKAAPFPFPLAVKINSADIPHKTEAGGVKLGINSVEELKVAAEAVTKSALAYKPGAKLEGVLVQQMASGLEVIVGGLNDACFGPTVVFGLGGIFAEVLKDVTYRFAPFGVEAAREMVQEIKGAIVMNGYRGKEKLDIEALAQTLSRVSWLLHDHKDRIAEMDINPLFMTPKSITAADALITLKA